MSFLVDLKQDEKKALPKFGDKSIAFVNKALEVALQNEDAFPRSLDIGEMKKGVRVSDFDKPKVCTDSAGHTGYGAFAI